MMCINWLVAEAHAGTYFLRVACKNFVYVEKFKASGKICLKQTIKRLEEGTHPKDLDGGVPISWWHELQQIYGKKRIVARGRFSNGVGKTIYFKEI